MGRKFRKTEISDKIHINDHGQYLKANYFCVNCHAVGTHEQHYGDCIKHESYAIPTSAEVPKKSASIRIWNIFKEQFVYPKVVGFWSHFTESYYYKNTIMKK